MTEATEKVVEIDNANSGLFLLKGWAQWGSKLTGMVFGNPRFSDGDVVTTSEVKYYYVVAVTKSGSHYILESSRVNYDNIGQE